MNWNWQSKNWPTFSWNINSLSDYEEAFIHSSGVNLGAKMHLSEEDSYQLIVEVLTSEALNTSEIEGELLDRGSVQSSIRKHFGLTTESKRIRQAEAGIADVMIDVYQSYNDPLTESSLFNWHKMILGDRVDIEVGSYRLGEDAMQVVSGPVGNPTVHFEAPPADKIKSEMKQFLNWFKSTAPKGKEELPALTRAGLVHLYFVSIHPFADGNGRIARALSEKSLAQSLDQPSLLSLSQVILSKRAQYYDALEANNKNLEVTAWLEYFAQTVLEAQSYSMKLVEFLIEKTKFYDRFRGQLNKRQEKVIERLFKTGIKGFEGGLSAENYIKIASTSRATATRDLVDLVKKNALIKTGQLKGTRYYLNISALAVGD